MKKEKKYTNYLFKKLQREQGFAREIVINWLGMIGLFGQLVWYLVEMQTQW